MSWNLWKNYSYHKKTVGVAADPPSCPATSDSHSMGGTPASASATDHLKDDGVVLK
jgi:hypothetical protein